jgi:hypothetical protein
MLDLCLGGWLYDRMLVELQYFIPCSFKYVTDFYYYYSLIFLSETAYNLVQIFSTLY